MAIRRPGRLPRATQLQAMPSTGAGREPKTTEEEALKREADRSQSRYLEHQSIIGRLEARGILVHPEAYKTASQKWAEEHGQKVTPYRYLGRAWPEGETHRERFAQLLEAEIQRQYVLAVQQHFEEEIGRPYDPLKKDKNTQEHLQYFLYKAVPWQVRQQLAVHGENYTVQMHSKAIQEAIGEFEAHEAYKVTQNLPRDKLATVGELIGYQRGALDKATPGEQLLQVYKGVKTRASPPIPAPSLRSSTLDDDLNEEAV